jgi:hypothetical protein
LFLTGNDADYVVSELEKQTGYKLKRNTKTGRVTIDRSVKRTTKGTSTWLANKVNQVTGDSQAWVQIKTGRNQPGIAGDSFSKREIDVADYDGFKKADPKFAARFLGHVLEEYYHAEKMPSPFSDQGRFPESHEGALEFESDVLSDFTGWWEKPREQKTISEKPGELTVRFDYSTVAYDVLYKSGVGGDVQVAKVTKIERRKPRAQ